MSVPPNTKVICLSTEELKAIGYETFFDRRTDGYKWHLVFDGITIVQDNRTFIFEENAWKAAAVHYLHNMVGETFDSADWQIRITQ